MALVQLKMFDSPQFLLRTFRFHHRRQMARLHALMTERYNKPAFDFYHTLRDYGLDVDTWIDVLPRQKLIYLNIPKSASTTIRHMLSRLETSSEPPDQSILYKRRCSGLLSPRLAGLGIFYEMASSADTLRFTFVRNPYARLVSAWSDRIAGRLDRKNRYAHLLFGHFRSKPRDDALDRPLTFASFVRFASETIDNDPDPHWRRQATFTTIPELRLGFIGRTENFQQDIQKVLDHARSPLRDVPHLNKSARSDWRSYYSLELAEIVYRTYEQDFDLFGYPRRLS